MVLPQDSYLRFGPYLDLMMGIRTALTINEGIIKVVAPEGCGKSSLCSQLQDDLVAEGHDVIFFETPPESVEFLHKRIQSELDLPRNKNFTRSLTQYLLAKKPPKNKLIIIYDDAEKISKDIFILIRLLNNVHDASDTLVSQVICGTPKLDKVFDDPDLRSLTQYLNQSFTLAPMTREELDDFCSGYSKLVGKTDKTVPNKVLTDIFMVSKGMPGKTLELLEKRLASASEQAPVPIDEPAPVEQPAESVDPIPEAAPSTIFPASMYDSEVKEILGTDIPRASTTPPYFKIVLGVIVVLATGILAAVLSGGNEAVNSRLARILADDSPLYMDEMESTSNAATPSPVQPATIPAETATTQTVVTEPALSETSNPVTALATAPDTESDTIPDALDTPAVEVDTTSPVITGDNGAKAMLADIENKDEELISEASLASEPVPTQTALADPVAVDTTGQQVPRTPVREVVVQVQEDIQDWLDAWQAGNFAGYLAAYHNDFEPAYHDSRQVWSSERESRVDSVTGITVNMDKFELLTQTPATVTVRFWLSYARGNYADDTLKEITLEQEDGRWLILEERNMELIIR